MAMKYRILQPRLPEEIRANINATTNAEVLSVFKRATMGDIESVKAAIEMNLYDITAYITADSLDEVYEIGNTRPDLVETMLPFSSVSVGDVIIADNDLSGMNAMVVDIVGFTPLNCYFGDK